MAATDGSLPVRKETAGPRAWTVWTLRAAVSLELLSLLLQALTAGGMLAGVAAQGSLHGFGSTFVHVFGLATLVGAILLWRPGRGPWWPQVVSLVVLVAGVVQSMLGGSDQVFAHVPVGATLIVLTTWLAGWSWTARTGSSQPARTCKLVTVSRGAWAASTMRRRRAHR